MRGGNVGAVCACGASFEAFRAVDDCGHELSYGSVRGMLRVGSDDPELWRSKSKGAVLRLWGQLKRDQWEVTHGYCAQALAEDPDDSRSEVEAGDTSFDPAALDNLATDTLPRCDCDHCTVARVCGTPLPVHQWQLREVLRLRCAPDQIRGVAWVTPPPAGQPARQETGP